MLALSQQQESLAFNWNNLRSFRRTVSDPWEQPRKIAIEPGTAAITQPARNCTSKYLSEPLAMAPQSASHDEILLPHLNRLLSSRDYPKTICPSEVSRALTAAELEALSVRAWRDLMPTVRQILWEMRRRGEVQILQGGIPVPDTVELQDIKGPIRARKIQD